MKQLFIIGIITLGFLSSCTSPRWVLIDKQYNPKEIVPRGLFLINQSELYLGARQGLFKFDLQDGFVHIPVPVDSDIVSRSLVKCNHALFAGYEGGGLWRSLDDGKTWEQTGQSFFDSNKLWGLFSYDSTVIAVTWPRYIYASSDQGKTWKDISQGMPAPGSMGVCFGHSQGMLLKDTALFCSVFNEGVFKRGLSQDEWIPARNGLPEDMKTRGICSYADNLFVGTENGVYHSIDNGEHWKPLNKGMEKVVIVCFWIEEKRLYAGSNKGQIFRSGDHGQHWELMSQGLHDKDVIYDIKKMNDDFYISVDGLKENLSGVYKYSAKVK